MAGQGEINRRERKCGKRAGNKLFADCLPKSFRKPSCFLGLLQTLVNILHVGPWKKCENNPSFAECHEFVECIFKTRSSIIVCRVHFYILSTIIFCEVYFLHFIEYYRWFAKCTLFAGCIW
jgi:hypothetical protein